MPAGWAKGVSSEDVFLSQIIVIFFRGGCWYMIDMYVLMAVVVQVKVVFWVYRVITNPLSRDFPTTESMIQ